MAVIICITVCSQGQHFQFCVELEQVLVHTTEVSCALPSCSYVDEQHTAILFAHGCLSLMGKSPSWENPSFSCYSLTVYQVTEGQCCCSCVSSLTIRSFVSLPPNSICLTLSCTSQRKKREHTSIHTQSHTLILTKVLIFPRM